MTSPSSMWRQGWRAGIDGGIPSGKFCESSDFMAGYNVGVSQRKAADLRCFMLYVKPNELTKDIQISNAQIVYECPNGCFKVAIDDGCYVVLIPDGPSGGWKPTPWIFLKAHEVLKELSGPTPRLQSAVPEGEGNG